MREELLVYGSPAIENAEIEEVAAVMQSGWLGTAPKVARFERDFAEYKVIEHTVALNSSTAAMHQLQRIETNWHRRKKIWQRYDEAFAVLRNILPAPVEPDTRHYYHLYNILIDEQRCCINCDRFFDAMTALNMV